MTISDTGSHWVREKRSVATEPVEFGSDVLVWLVSLLPPVVIMLAVAFQPWVPAGDLLRDPLAVAEMREDCCKVYFGAVSNLGILIWISGAAACLFGAAVLFARRQFSHGGLFLLSGGLFTGFLALDDMFLIHENVLPAFGVSQPVTYGAYGLLGLAYLAIGWRQIFANRFVLFGLAGGLLACSVMIDWLIHDESATRILLEDGAKLIGICAWTAFHALAAINLVLRDPHVRSAPIGD